MIAILWTSNPALIPSRRRAGAVGDGINGRAPAHQGMGAGRPAIVGQRGVENAVKTRGIIAIRGGCDIGRAGGKVLKGLIIGQPR